MQNQLSASDISLAKAYFSRFSELFDRTMQIARTSKLGFDDPTVIMNTNHLEELANALKAVAGHPPATAPSIS